MAEQDNMSPLKPRLYMYTPSQPITQPDAATSLVTTIIISAMEQKIYAETAHFGEVRIRATKIFRDGSSKGQNLENVLKGIPAKARTYTKSIITFEQ
jgi:hypothetical protein